jgi:hypothetical protein
MSHMHMFSNKFKLTHRYFTSWPSICKSWINHVNFLYFLPSKICDSQTTLSPPFSLSGAASPLADVATLPRHVIVPSHETKMSSLPPLHLPTMLHPIVLPLKLKLKHWIHTTAAGHPPQTAQLPLSTTIKGSSQP